MSAFQRERYRDVTKLLSAVVATYPDVAEARELHGLAQYRQGRFKAAAVELEAHRALTDSNANLHILADCYRGLRKYRRVEEVWTELREASPSAAIVAEGRIVAAGALADQGKIREAMALLSAAEAAVKRPKEHHVRMWYALGDLYDRSGETTRARALFARVQQTLPGYADVEARLAALGR